MSVGRPGRTCLWEGMAKYVCGKAWQNKAAHLIEIRKQSPDVCAGGILPSSRLANQCLCYWMLLPTINHVPSPVTHLYKNSQRHTQKCVLLNTLANLKAIKWTMKINHNASSFLHEHQCLPYVCMQ